MCSKFYAIFTEEPKFKNDTYIDEWHNLLYIYDSREAGLMAAMQFNDQNKQKDLEPSCFLVEMIFIEPNISDMLMCAFNGNKWTSARANTGRVDEIKLKNIKR